MLERFHTFALLILLALALLACQLIGQIGRSPTEPGGLPAPSRAMMTPAKISSETAQAFPSGTQTSSLSDPGPTRTLIPSTNQPTTGAYPKPPQSRSAEIRPTEMRSALTHLSSLIGLRVLDGNGAELGTVSDYIVNTCETYLLYILMEPVPNLAAQPGLQLVIPYEAATVNSGLLDAQTRAIHLRLSPAQLTGAPVFPTDQRLTPTDWEAAVRDFWSKQVRLGSLQTSCNVPGGPVYKVAYASQLLQAPLYDGRGELLGTVQEAILAPESGKLGFYIVQPSGSADWVMVRLSATNIPKEALKPEAALSLELLTDPQMFWGAPRLSSLDEADDFTMQGKMLQYWSR